MPPTKIQENWPLSLGEETKNRYSRWPSWISDRNDFSDFLIYKSSTGLLVQEKNFQDDRHGGQLGFPIATI